MFILHFIDKQFQFCYKYKEQVGALLMQNCEVNKLCWGEANHSAHDGVSRVCFLAYSEEQTGAVDRMRLPACETRGE